MKVVNNISRLIEVNRIFLEPDVRKYNRGLEILRNYPDAELIEVPSHWNIPSLHGNEGAVEDWIKNKRSTLILGVKKSLTCRPNERSSHFVAPSISNGCTMACSYCYVPRRKGFANPITIFVNTEQICNYIIRHAGRQGMKFDPDQIDPQYWVYDIGENCDCAVDASISDNVKDFVALFRSLPNAKATFATKFVNPELLTYDPQKKTRVRFSLMPQNISKIVDVRTSPISDRIAAVNEFVAAGYEVHLNFSPVIYYDEWLADYSLLFNEVDETLNEVSKKQLRCEVIFLTHNTQLHEINMEWHPKGEALLWKPDLQEIKYSQTGGKNLRYKWSIKVGLVNEFKALLQKELPYCEVRYAF